MRVLAWESLLAWVRWIGGLRCLLPNYSSKCNSVLETIELHKPMVGLPTCACTHIINEMQTKIIFAKAPANTDLPGSLLIFISLWLSRM